jgi:hypothetical protein
MSKTHCEVFAAEEKSHHGGARKGSGRKPTGNTKRLWAFSISFDVLEKLQAIPSGQRSKFVEKAIRAALL